MTGCYWAASVHSLTSLSLRPHTALSSVLLLELWIRKGMVFVLRSILS